MNCLATFGIHVFYFSILFLHNKKIDLYTYVNTLGCSEIADFWNMIREFWKNLAATICSILIYMHINSFLISFSD